jgi:osmotically-inducible protein OsmY
MLGLVIAPLTLGSKVRFADRWSGRLTAFEIDDSWEVVNLLVTEGLFRQTTVKLPADAATWDANRVEFADVPSGKAFGREVPPVAVPARALSQDTSLSLPGTRLLGALTDVDSRRATGILLVFSGKRYRLPVENFTMSGKELLLTTRTEAMEPYYSDEELEDAAREAIRRSRAVSSDEFSSLDVSVSGANLLVAGNARTPQSVNALREVVSSVAGVQGSEVNVADDFGLEAAVAQALYRNDVTRGAEVYPRSALGVVALFGQARSPEVAADAVRVASKVPGIRAVHDRLDVSGRAPAAA